MNDKPPREIVFLLPTALDGQQGPVAGWLNTAGWATAAAQLGFGSTVITPLGPLDSNALRLRASQPTLTGVRPQWRAALPLPLKLILKDAREWIRSRKFARVISRVEVSADEVAFVWQRHELFQRAGRKLANRIGCAHVLYVPAPKVWEARNWGVRRRGWERVIERLGDVAPIREADVVACISEEVADAVVGIGVDRSRVLLTPSTVDTELFRPGIDAFEVRRRYELEGRFVVGWTGSFRTFHGIELLLDAVKEVRKYLPQVVVMLVGDGPERAHLQAESQRLGLENVIRFTGTLRQTEIPEVLSAFDVAIVTSRADQNFYYSPLKLWEYLATARAVIAPSIGSLTRLLENGVNAILVQPGDSHALANAIIRLAHDPVLRVSLGGAGRDLAQAASWTHQLQQLLDRLDAAGYRF